MAWRPNPEAEAAIIVTLSLSDMDAEARLSEYFGKEDNCPRCGCVNYYRITRRECFRCMDCRYKYTALSKTPFHGAKKRKHVYLAAMIGFLAVPPMSCLRWSNVVGVNMRSGYDLKRRIEEWRNIEGKQT